ncbi:MAG: MarR family transcriptional regulator [Clostridia bacterium]|nr:MarR family transcriptional regulator [Clostridia bacterium]
MEDRYEVFSLTVAGVHRCIQKIETEEMEKYGLKGSYAQYLAAIRRNGNGMTLSQLSEFCMKDKAAVSRAIAEMEAKGLVCRVGEKENAYRAKLTLTERGEAVADFVSKRATAAVKLAGKGLTDEDRKIFYSVLDLISSNLREISKNGLPEEQA